MTGRAENLEDYYEPGKEVRAIAQAGYERTLREHTYAHRFDSIFRRLGMPCEPLDMILQGKVSPGHTEEVR